MIEITTSNVDRVLRMVPGDTIFVHGLLAFCTPYSPAELDFTI